MKRRLLAILLGIALLVSAMPSFATETPVVPELPVVEEPVAPVVEEPVVPVVEEPVAPVAEQPVAPVVEEPVAPVVEEPVAPVVEQPVAPVIETPVTPVIEEPAPVVPETPVEEPAVPVIPETPVVEEPVVEPEQPVVEPEVPAETNPTPVMPVDPMNPVLPEELDPSVPVAPEEEYPEDELPEEPSAPVVPVVPTGDPLYVSIARETSYVYVGENAMTVSVEISGGTAPYTVQATFAVGDEAQEVVTNLYTQPGVYAISHLPGKGGEWRVTVDVTDATGLSYADSVKIFGSVRTVESSDDFESSIYGVKLTGDWRVDIIAVAQCQLGYKESSTNAIIDADGSRKGATLYGQWMGDPYSEWCASFLAYTMKHANISIADQLCSASVGRWLDKTRAMGAYRNTDYFPQSGDIIFIIPEGEDAIGHIGLVEFVTEGTIGTIEANVSDAVARRSYRADSSRIGGYASMEALMEYAGVEFEEEAAVTYEVTEMEDRFAYVNMDKVNMRAEPNSDGERLFKHLDQGTQVTVTASLTVDDVLWYQVQYKDRMGYIRGDLLDVDLVQGEEEVSDCGCYDAETAEQLCDETCACLCHGFELSVEEDAVLLLDGEKAEEAVEETIVCTCTDETGAVICTEDCTCPCHTAEEVAEEPELPAEIVEWMNTTTVTDEMLERALNASSLESIVIEGSDLIYVRTGEKVGTYNAETGAIKEKSLGLVVAYVDPESNTVRPVVDGDDD